MQAIYRGNNMIIKETINGLIHTYSDTGMKIHGGFPQGDYDEAYDPIDREYIETNIPITIEEGTDEDYAIAGRIMMGVIP